MERGPLRSKSVGLQTVLILCLWLTVRESGACDPIPQTSPNVPVMIVPLYHEQGAPSFTTPLGDMNSGTPTVAAPGNGASTGDGGGFISTNFTQDIGQAIGSGQCVALIQATDPSVGLTASWRQGESVQGNTSIQPGTAIATFDSNGLYANATDGSSHAAIYIGQNAEGIQVEDQWAGHAASDRTIRWTNASGIPADTGSAFHVVTHTS